MSKSTKRPSTKLRRITKLQIPKKHGARLVLEHWCFSLSRRSSAKADGAWGLDGWCFYDGAWNLDAWSFSLLDAWSLLL